MPTQESSPLPLHAPSHAGAGCSACPACGRQNLPGEDEIATFAAPTRTFPRGVHPPERKHLAADTPIEVLAHCAEVRIPLLQHLGAPCEASVKARTDVAVGDEVGRATAFVSAPVHASVTGTTARGAMVTLPNGPISTSNRTG